MVTIPLILYSVTVGYLLHMNSVGRSRTFLMERYCRIMENYNSKAQSLYYCKLCVVAQRRYIIQTRIYEPERIV